MCLDKFKTAIEQIVKGHIEEGIEVQKPALNTHKGVDIFKIIKKSNNNKENNNNKEWFLKLPLNEEGAQHILRGQRFYEDSDSQGLIGKLVPQAIWGVVKVEEKEIYYLATERVGSNLDKRVGNMLADEFNALLVCLFVPKETCGNPDIAQKYEGHSLYETLKDGTGKDLKSFLTAVVERTKNYLNKTKNYLNNIGLTPNLETIENKIKGIEDSLPMKLMWVPTDLLPRNITVIKTTPSKENPEALETYKLYLIDQFKPIPKWPLYGPPHFIIDFFKRNRDAYPDLFQPTPRGAIDYLVSKLEEVYGPIIDGYPRKVTEIIQEVLEMYYKCKNAYKICKKQTQEKRVSQLPLDYFSNQPT